MAEAAYGLSFELVRPLTTDPLPDALVRDCIERLGPTRPPPFAGETLRRCRCDLDGAEL